MSQADVSKRQEGMARKSARVAVERETAQRELQHKLHQIEILRTFSNRQFARLNRTIFGAAFWLVVIAVLFGVVGWYGNEAFGWLLAQIQGQP